MNIVELDDYFINLDNVTRIEVSANITPYGEVEEVYKLNEEFYTIEPIVSCSLLGYSYTIGSNIRIRNAKTNKVVAQSGVKVVSSSSGSILEDHEAFGNFDDIYDRLRSTGERIDVANTQLDVRIIFHFTSADSFEYVLRAETRKYNENFEHTQPEFDLDTAKQEAKNFVKSLYSKTLE